MNASSGSGFGRRELAIVVGVTLFLLVPVYAATASWDILQSNDPRSAALAGWTLVTTGDLAFDEEWPPARISWPAEGRDGRLYSNRFPGVIALAAAGYAVPVLIGVVPDGPLDHPHRVPIWPATLMAVLVGALAAALTYRMFRETDVSREAAALAGAMVALGSPLWSVSASALWTHGPTHALLVGILLALLSRRLALAACLALVVVTFRPHLIVAVLTLAIGERSWRGRAWLSAGGFAGLLAVAAYSFRIFGQPLPAAGYGIDRLLGGMPLSSPAWMMQNVFDWLLDPHRGVLIFVPALLLAVPRLPTAWKSAPRWVRVAALSGVAYAFTQLGLIRASGGDLFFGHRTTIEALVLASPLLLLSVERLFAEGSVARIATASTVGISIVLHGFGAWIDMPRDTKELLREELEQPEFVGLPSRSGATAPRYDVPWTTPGPETGRLSKELSNHPRNTTFP